MKRDLPVVRMAGLGVGLLALLLLPASSSPVGPDIEARARLIKGGPHLGGGGRICEHRVPAPQSGVHLVTYSCTFSSITQCRNQ